MQVESLNRGLGQAEVARGNDECLNQEFSRNYSKAENYCPQIKQQIVILPRLAICFSKGATEYAVHT